MQLTDSGTQWATMQTSRAFEVIKVGICVLADAINRLRDAVGYDAFRGVLFFLFSEKTFDVVELHEGFDGGEAVDVEVDDLVFDVQQ